MEPVAVSNINCMHDFSGDCLALEYNELVWSSLVRSPFPAPNFTQLLIVVGVELMSHSLFAVQFGRLIFLFFLLAIWKGR